MPVKGGAVDLMGTLTEGQTRDSVLVPREAVHMLPISQVPDVHAPVPATSRQEVAVRADCQSQERLGADQAGCLADPLWPAIIPQLAWRLHRCPLGPASLLSLVMHSLVLSIMRHALVRERMHKSGKKRAQTFSNGTGV